MCKFKGRISDCEMVKRKKREVNEEETEKGVIR
jgi:hypothetical protein